MALDPPQEVVDSWSAPNLVNPETRGGGLLILAIVLSVLGAMALALRIYSRVFFRRNFGADDWLILPAAIFFHGFAGITILGCMRFKWGYHVWDMPFEMRQKSLLLTWIAEIFLTWCLMLTKLSMCFFYLRLLGGTQSRTHKRILYLLMAVIATWGVGFTVAIVLQCKPVKAVYIINYPGEECVSRQGGAIAHAGLDIVTDLLIYCLPIRKMWTLQVPRRQKILVVGLFALGAIVCIASIARLPATLRSMSEYDVTYYMWTSYLWTVLECGVGIMIACMPSLTPLVVRYVPGLALQHSSHGTPPKYIHRGSKTKIRHTMARAFPNLHAAHSYPLADISTTVTGVVGGDWWGESEENIMQGHNKNKAQVPVEGKITKTTVIEQTVHDEDGMLSA